MPTGPIYTIVFSFRFSWLFGCAATSKEDGFGRDGDAGRGEGVPVLGGEWSGGDEALGGDAAWFF